MPVRPTLTQVAAVAGVSLAVASRVLNGKAAQYRIAPATIGRVREVAMELGYLTEGIGGAGHRHPGRPRIAVLLTASIDLRGSSLQSMPVELARAAHVHGCALVLELLDDAETWLRQAPDPDLLGVVIDYSCAPHYDQLRTRLGIPAVLFNWSDPLRRLDAVEPDHSGGINAGIDHLADLGHRRIAYLTNIRSTLDSHQRLRLAAGHQACARRGITLLELPWQSAADSRTIATAAAASDGPTALLAGGTEMPSLVTALRGQGLAIPQRISLLSIDDSDVLQRLDPPITAIELPMAGMAQTAIGLVLRRQCEPRADPVLHQQLERVLVRGSTATG